MINFYKVLINTPNNTILKSTIFKGLFDYSLQKLDLKPTITTSDLIQTINLFIDDYLILNNLLEKNFSYIQGAYIGHLLYIQFIDKNRDYETNSIINR